jgi:hypothetical protein
MERVNERTRVLSMRAGIRIRSVLVPRTVTVDGTCMSKVAAIDVKASPTCNGAYLDAG